MNRVGLQCEADVGKRVRWKDRARTMQRSLTDTAQKLIVISTVIGSNRLPARSILTTYVVGRSSRDKLLGRFLDTFEHFPNE
jgi:hypothetical protein